MVLVVGNKDLRVAATSKDNPSRQRNSSPILNSPEVGSEENIY
jgi:hypothetical protein